MAAIVEQVERPDITGLTHHGGRVDLAARMFPHTPRPWIDLSTGINPIAWPGAADCAGDLQRLPSVTALAELEATAAEAFGATGAIAALPGTEIGLRLLAWLGLPAPYRFVAPGYRTHAEAFPGVTPIDAEALLAACDDGGTILIANPNNPDGRIIAPDRLRTAAARLSARGGRLVVDEAFADVDPAISVLPHLGPDDGVLVFRSFGKIFGLAGVRLGFVCGPEATIAAVRRMLGSWPVSSTALAIGTGAYCDTDWIAQTRIDLAQSAVALDRVLARHGLSPQGACPLFRLVAHDDAAGLFVRLAQAGILVRTFDHAPRWLRFGLPAGVDELARLDAALSNG